MQTAIIKLPWPLAQFRCVRAGPTPFVRLLDFLRKESGLPCLQFGDVAIGAHDFADLKHEVMRWVLHRRHLGLPVREEGTRALSVEGVSAPMINRKLRPGDALVVLRAEVSR